MKFINVLLGKRLFFMVLLLTSQMTFAEDGELAEVFEKLNVNGTIVISSLDGKYTYIHNNKRANKRLSPASTFKIPNSLIALEEKVLHDENEIISWDGVARDLDSWNKDQTLLSAFKTSCLWVYQALAKKIGQEKYVKYLTTMDYGNAKPAPDITSFWLKGNGLKISALEQVKFLKATYLKKYNFSENVYNSLKKIMFEEENDNYQLYSKTGAATENWVGHGWYVGYIVNNDQPWFFATNILVNERDDLRLRKQVTLDCLRQKGII